jgi:porphobilinogen synthase
VSEGQTRGVRRGGSEAADTGREPGPAPTCVTPGPVRLRRLRFSPGMRAMVRETDLRASDLIYPLFVRPGVGVKRRIVSMPGQFQWSPDTVVEEVAAAAERGVAAVMLFGIPDFKDSCGTGNLDPDGPVPSAARALKKELPELVVMSDMCFCEYTEHGHCGAVNLPNEPHHRADLPEGYLLNDLTLDLLGRASVVHASAGADVIAPSGMIDGMVGAVRAALDAGGREHTTIMSYAAKYASAFYGPFRDAAESPPQFGDRAQYQMDPANWRQALREVELDVAEGADIVMVKPALPYLDVIRAVRDAFNLPLAAYQVSGEYAMIQAAAANGWLDLQKTALESLVGIKRAGADMILTYFAKEAAGWLA